jgi:hypothetical protein
MASAAIGKVKVTSCTNISCLVQVAQFSSAADARATKQL